MKLRNQLLIDDLRRRYFVQGWTHSEIQSYVASDHRLQVSIRTLKRWKQNLRSHDWLGPTVPTPRPQPAIAPEQVFQIIRLRQLTGWSSYSLSILRPDISISSCKRVIKKHGLSRGSKIENKRIHWVKWERDHPDSLWQLDSWQLPDGSWIVDVIDDATRFCPGIARLEHLTTQALTAYLDTIIAVHGAPRELLTDNGAEHGGMCRQSMFDAWCQRHHITHIRSRVHKPTTAGKVERFHQTVQRELPYCNGDFELFRYRYNHIRPHMSLSGRRPADKYFDIKERLKEPRTKQREYWRG
jgi:transposase